MQARTTSTSPEKLQITTLRPALADVLRIITQPQAHHSPALRMFAWSALKASRGQRISQYHLCRMHPCLKAQVAS